MENIHQKVLIKINSPELLANMDKRPKSESRKNQKSKALAIFRRGIEYLLTPKKKENMDSDENLNNYDESEMKIIDCQMSISILFTCMIVSMVIAIPVITQKYMPTVMVPQKPNQFGKYRMIFVCLIFIQKSIYCQFLEGFQKSAPTILTRPCTYIW